MKKLIFLIGPIALLIGLFFAQLYPENALQYKALGIIAWMVLWWITEIVDIPVTALLPIVLFPLLGLSDLKSIGSNYGHPIIFLFMGGFFIAIALEKWQLHERFALLILKRTGSSEKGVLAGFMISTAALSMWISNTACTLMMLPIAQSVLVYFDKLKSTHSKLPLTLMIALAASANIGGFMTLIGTPPNVVMTGLMKELNYKTPDFAEWLLIGIPIGVIILLAVYYLLSEVLFKLSKRSNLEIEYTINQKIVSIGKVSKPEKKVLAIFIATALLWIFKDAINHLISYNLLNDTAIAMMGGISLFITPSSDNKKTLLVWEDVIKLPWGILLLFGGGLNIAMIMENTGIINEAGRIIGNFDMGSTLFLVLIATTLASFATEIMSNVALATILIPVIAAVGVAFNFEPALLVIPVTIACSCAFMMPISTPPNAIVYASGRIKMSEMIKTGIWFNIIASIVIALLSYWIVPFVL
jgi:solute carrier family 13 (sodium-dependent dicarboxylate transporter), member 2/3/5